MKRNAFRTRLLLLINVPVIIIAMNFSKNDFQEPATGTFPGLKAETLSGEEVNFPSDLTDDVNILILVFEQQAQPLVNTWADLVLDEFEPQAGISYYEVPMISTLYFPIAWQIDNWMRDGIPAELHDNTVTFYGNRTPYFETLAIEDKSSCYLFVVDKQGRIRYRAEGALNEQKEAYFRAAVASVPGFEL